MNGVARRLAATALIGAMRVAVRVLPSARIAAVSGFPDTEENSLRVAGELVRQLPPDWRVVLLCNEIDRARAAYDITVPDGPELEFVRRQSPRGLQLAAVARVWASTHGLFGSPRGSRGRCFVLLGHGHGPKRATPRHPGASGHYADLAVTNVATWGRSVLNDLGVPADAQIVETPSPRSEGLPAGGSTRRVLWLPTVRRTIAMARAQWQDGTRLVADNDVAQAVSALQAAVADRGLELVIKVHELDDDAEAYADLGLRVVTSDDLLDQGLTFQRFVRESAALVTDYSSVFVDHLDADLPIAFWTPDLAEFEADRGFNEPDFRQVAPELLLRGVDDATEFLDCAAAGTPWQPEARRRLADAIGYVPGDDHATERLVARILKETGVPAGTQRS
jgi:CDP-glycerol glycerophosphotransferase